MDETTVVLKGVPTWIDTEDFNSDARIISTKRITEKMGKKEQQCLLLLKHLKKLR
jgi:hypothetical protein